MESQNQRLFIGGLNSGTSEKDIRERFKTFGSVLSVELHKVQKKDGFPEKTFAYMNIESTETNIRRCISMLSNTKWRGGILKVEPAKENFLLRLKKERELQHSNTIKHASKETVKETIPKELLEPVKNAVPGTPIPGQCNWVVGKFGRALPIVHMKSKHGRKVTKFDPSKTVHNLKRIRDDTSDSNVSGLTWNLEPTGRHDPWDTSNGFQDTSSSDSEEDVISDKRSVIKNKLKRAKADKEHELKNSKSSLKFKEVLDSKDKFENINNLLEKDHSEKLHRKKKKRAAKMASEKDGHNSTSDENDSEMETEKSGKGKRNQEIAFEVSYTCEVGEDELDEISCMQPNEMMNEENNNYLSTDKKQKSRKRKHKQIRIDQDNLTLNENEPELLQNDDDYLKKVAKKKKSKRKSLSQENQSFEESFQNIQEIVDNDEIITKHKGNKKKQFLPNSGELTVNENSDLECRHDTDQKIENFLKPTSKSEREEILDNDVIITNQKRNKKKKEKRFLPNSELAVNESDFEDFEGKHDTEKKIETFSTPPSKSELEEISRKLSTPTSKSEQEEAEINRKLSTPISKSKQEEAEINRKLSTPICKSKQEEAESVDDEESDSSEKEKAVVKTKKNKKTKKSKSDRLEDLTKKVESNEKRIKAINDRKTAVNSQQSVISLALQNLDTKQHKHLTFDDRDDNNDNNETKQKPQDISGKISGEEASNWLGLDSDDTNDDASFDAKPQFEGKTGQKLFQLQKTYRGDSRFKLDERFIESDDDGDDESKSDVNQSDDSADDEWSKQLSQEKDMEMSVLKRIFGENFATKNTPNSQKKTFMSSSILRYDPLNDEHAQYEESQKNNEKIKENMAKQMNLKEDKYAVINSDGVGADSNVPKVGKDKFYDVKVENLTNLFSRKSKPDDSPFTFLSNLHDNDEPSGPEEWDKEEELTCKPFDPVMLPYDSSGDEQAVESEEEQDNDMAESQTTPSLPQQTFFFHFGDPELENPVYDQEKPFMRTATLEELNEYWVKVRGDLTYDYKKKHKDALRRRSKMAAKSFRT